MNPEGRLVDPGRFGWVVVYILTGGGRPRRPVSPVPEISGIPVGTLGSSTGEVGWTEDSG